MKVFAKVAHRSGFAAAARDLRMSTAAVSKHVAFLESRVGARLLERTTRKVRLTEAGRVYLEHINECLQTIEDADASVGELAKQARGHLRVSAPVDLVSQLAPIVARYLNANSQISIELQFSNRPVDLIEESIDVAIRVAPALDGRFVALPIARTQVAVFASPDYLRKYGVPRTPEELDGHRGLVFLEPRPRDEWTLVRGGRSVRVKLKGMLTTNSGAALAQAAAHGAGLVVAPSFVTQGEHATGRITRVLPEWRVLPELMVFAVYPHRRFLAPKVRTFVEALRMAFGDSARDPWWSDRPTTRKSRPVAAVQGAKPGVRPG
jgi:DNA-binding transcriptional LysR family regulator